MADTVSVVPDIEPVKLAVCADVVVPIMVTVVDTVDDALKLYVPIPPVPVPSDEMVVPSVTPLPLTVYPTAREPETTAMIVKTEPEIVP